MVRFSGSMSWVLARRAARDCFQSVGLIVVGVGFHSARSTAHCRSVREQICTSPHHNLRHLLGQLRLTTTRTRGTTAARSEALNLAVVDQVRSSWDVDLVRSAGSVRRSRTAAASLVSHPLRREKVVNERRVATWRFQVVGAQPPHVRAVRESGVYEQWNEKSR